MTEMQSCLLNDGCHVKTIINGNGSSYTFSWTLEKFSKFPLGTEKKSPTFHLLPNQKFYVTLLIKDNLQGYLKFHHVSGTPIEVNHIVSMKNKAGQVVLENVKLHKYAANLGCDVLPDCTTIMKKAIEEDVLIIKCVMEICGEDKTDTYFYKSHSKSVSQLDDLPALSNDLKAIYDKHLNADLSLKVGDNIVRVHKLILCARSSVFARMFETPMGESEKNAVDITDLELPALKDLVSYMYTGVLANGDDFESVYALYYAADKYDVPSLRKKCAAVLLSKMDFENACRILVLADQHSDIDFKNAVMDFIKFHFSKFLETDAWKELVDNTPRFAIEFLTLWGKKSAS